MKITTKNSEVEMQKRNLLSLVLLASLVVLLSLPVSVLAQENSFTHSS